MAINGYMLTMVKELEFMYDTKSKNHQFQSKIAKLKDHVSMCLISEVTDTKTHHPNNNKQIKKT